MGASRLAADQPVSLPSCWLSLEGGLLYAFVGPAAAVVLVLTPSPLAQAGALGCTHCPFRVTMVNEGWMVFLAPLTCPQGTGCRDWATVGAFYFCEDLPGDPCGFTG